MLREKHNLNDDFPGHMARITELKASDDGFRQLVKQYHELDHEVRGLEMRDVPSSDAYFDGLKRRRVHLKDEIYQKLSR
ncbi:YdcH family protein [Endozoicomonadaceae bacterium StTr2]